MCFDIAMEIYSTVYERRLKHFYCYKCIVCIKSEYYQHASCIKLL